MNIERVDIPSLAEDEVLVRVAVALTYGTDFKVWKQGSHPRMIHPPALFGHELAGIVEEKGSAVNGGVHTGMRVVPANSAPCNVCFYCRKGQPNLARICCSTTAHTRNTFAFRAGLCSRTCWKFRTALRFVDAAMVEPLACVLRGIHETGIQPATRWW